MSASNISSHYSLQYTAGDSAKFWNASVDDRTLVIRFGRIGTLGQTYIRTYVSPEMAAFERDRRAQSKLQKGYQTSSGLRFSTPIVPASVRSKNLQNKAPKSFWQQILSWFDRTPIACFEQEELRCDYCDAKADPQERVCGCCHAPL